MKPIGIKLIAISLAAALLSGCNFNISSTEPPLIAESAAPHIETL